MAYISIVSENLKILEKILYKKLNIGNKKD
jgi:hypothetical protein